MSRHGLTTTTLDVRVEGNYVPYREATRDCPAEGGMCEDVRVYIDHPNVDSVQGDITARLPVSMLVTLSRILADQMREEQAEARHDSCRGPGARLVANDDRLS